MLKDAPEISTRSFRSGASEVDLAECDSLRYCVQMKRSIPKLAVRCETIRLIATQELARVAGGGTVLTESCKVNCTLPDIKSPAG